VSVIIQPRLDGEALPQPDEIVALGAGRLVAGTGPAVGLQEVRLVEFPDLVAQRVLESVPSLFA
jgi:hypothetical protein